MNHHKNLLTYWRTCLYQGMRAEIDVEHSECFVPEENLWEQGVLPDVLTNTLFEKEEKRINTEKGLRSPQDPKWERPEYMILWWSPFYILPQDNLFVKPIYPFWIPLRLQRTGSIAAPEACTPIIPREWMSPVGWEEADYIFCKLEEYEKCLELRPKTAHWDDYKEFINQIFEQLTQQNIQSFNENDYPVVHQHTLIIPDKDNQAASALLALFDYLITAKKLPLLLENSLSLVAPQEKQPMAFADFMQYHVRHLGQMSHQFALSLTQRQALYSMQALEQGEIFALNGPPGTGKTTFLQSVVANEVVLSALKGQAPAIVLACAATNQAVTNIQESFTSTTVAQDAFRCRWIPDLEGYATFLSARNKPEKELQGINYLKADESGTFAKMEQELYVEKAAKAYLIATSQYLQIKVEEVSEAYFYLQKELRSIQQYLDEGQLLWQEICRAIEAFANAYVEVAARPTLTTTHGFWLDFQTALEEQLWLIKSSARPSIRQTVLALDKLEDTSRKGLMQFFTDALKGVIAINLHWKNWNKWRKKQGIRSNPVIANEQLWALEYNKIEQPHTTAYFFDELDITLRNKAFYLAIHYWEGRWIEKMQEQLKNEAPNKGRQGRMTLWQTRAMLTPCFVSTFFMAPKFFSYHKFLGEDDEGHKLWENPPLQDFVDYLIVDEAGQVSPEVGISVFALAKKALIVGDTQQIEPVWKTIPKIDIGYLLQHEVIKQAQDPLLAQLQTQGYLASSGSLMQMAQHLTPWLDPHNSTQPKGIMLLEHRRCHEEIISFCNNIAYGGMLRPMKSVTKTKQLFPPMVLLTHQGQSMVQGKDRFNTEEAKMLVIWLLQNRSRIEQHFARIDQQRRSIENLVGIITPFRGQRKILYKLLKEAGFDTHRMKVGTVHALQGAEREIILFSPVYGAGDVKVMFFDRNNRPNMLNVAVSRAKQSFIVVGNENLFVAGQATPSSKLRSYLQKLS